MAEYRKWNEKTRAYEPYTVPDEWNLLTYANDMDEPCNCAQCGKPMRYGDGYTSMQVHTPVGFGYMVCESCYAAEREERFGASDDQ